ncbi:MAG: hypothetical protein H6738_12340 [Alphaproteobacteria bacterium]|nr:hypothetical protein [Alphaproteobacteria bacterium]
MTWRDQLRAAAITLALVANAVYALPIPPAITAEKIKEEGRQRDLEMWERLLGGVGLSVERERLEELVVSVTTTLADGHKLLKTPFRPVFDLLGADQSWALFASATTRPERLEIAVRRKDSADFEVLLRRLDPCCSWHEGQLEYRRIRGVWDGQGKRMRPAYKGLTKWIAEQVFAEMPDAVQVRVRLIKERSTYPWEEDDPSQEPVLQRVHVRGRAEGGE